MKRCSKCNENTSIVNFRKRKIRGKDWINSICKKCESNIQKTYYKKNKTKLDFLVGVMYRMQIVNSKKRKHKEPTYSQNELKEWIKKQPNFLEIMNGWKKSGYSKNLKPSVDRIDDYKGYSFDNIRLVTTIENIRKGHSDRKNGINNKISNSIVMLEKNGGKIKEFASSMIAYRETGVNPSNIRQCVKGFRKSAGGYLWVSKEQ